jgi:hypothetical protein
MSSRVKRSASSLAVTLALLGGCDTGPESAPPGETSTPTNRTPAPAPGVESTEQDFSLVCWGWRIGAANPLWAGSYWAARRTLQVAADNGILLNQDECKKWGAYIGDIPLAGKAPSSLIDCLCGDVSFPSPSAADRPPVYCLAGGKSCISMVADKEMDWAQFSTLTRIAPCSDSVGNYLNRYQKAPGEPPTFGYCFYW